MRLALALLATGCTVKTWSSTTSSGGQQPQSGVGTYSEQQPTQAAAPAPAFTGKAVEMSSAKGTEPLVLRGTGTAVDNTSSPRIGAPCDDPSGHGLTRTEAPLAVLHVDRPTKVVLATKYNVQVVSSEQQKFWCYRGDHGGYDSREASIYRTVGEVDLAPGTYRFYGLAGDKGRSAPLDATLTLADKLQASAWTDGTRLPMAELSYGGRNPALVELGPATRPVFGKYLGLSCGDAEREYIGVADLNIKESATYKFRAHAATGYGLVVASKDGACVKNTGKLAAGMYRVFLPAFDANGREAPREGAVLVESPDFPMTFGDADTIKLPALDQPFPIAAKVGKVLVDNGVCGNGVAPAAYIDIDRADEEIELRVLATTAKANIALAGPLKGETRCNDHIEGYGQKLAKGRYALFVTGKDAGEAWVVIRKNLPWYTAPKQLDKARGEPLWRAKNRGGTDTVAGRAVFMHYPFWPSIMGDGTQVEALFDDAPAELFVFTSKPFRGLQPGEPLLLTWYGAEKSTVLRANGARVEVDSDVLTTKRGGEITMPEALAAVEKPDDIDEMWKIASARDRGFMAELREGQNKVRNCVNDYRRKHDPTYGKDYDLINTQTGASMRDVRSSQAAASCGVAAYDKKLDAAFARLQKTRLKEQKELPGKLAAKLE